MAASSVPSIDAGEALERLRSADPPLFLSPSSDLSACARAASRSLFSSLLPYCPKAPLDSLLTDEGFDAEQIWSQIDLFSRPILSLIRREVKRLERVAPPVSVVVVKESGREEEDEEMEEGVDEDDEEGEEEEENDDDEGGEDEEEEDEKKDGRSNGVEDRFLKIKELEDYLEDDEAREYGFQRKEGSVKRKEVEDGSDENEGNGDDDDAEFEDLDGGDEDVEDARYEDFFVGKRDKAKNSKGGIKREGPDGSKELFSDEDEDDGMDIDEKNGGALSTYEKELLKLRSKIQEMEKANLEPKTWTMQGEVTAAKRPKNSALEVDLDFEHNVRPPPVITEEVTASIEDLIKKRIIEGHFDDVQRAPDLPSRAPKEFKEMDETKSKKGLAEIYEEEYAQKAGLAPAPLSSSDKTKEEASFLFKRLCLKLDALAHFHFAPKPVIEEMSIKANVPALAMEEIAPVAVSDAAMLAPEEVFQGKGDVKEEAELTQSDRRRRRANKKRRFKDRSKLSISKDASAKQQL
ncbi:hypothetical protein M5K25_002505 [Dendrobium thyrsiflorum]|uniref:Uncharacterized protein n=1 Tax=Dendrobium thyrsiflorum TaxID=117978 RepID=A0ABD0VNS0_DENTH